MFIYLPRPNITSWVFWTYDGWLVLVLEMGSPVSVTIEVNHVAKLQWFRCRISGIAHPFMTNFSSGISKDLKRLINASILCPSYF